MILITSIITLLGIFNDFLIRSIITKLNIFNKIFLQFIFISIFTSIECE